MRSAQLVLASASPRRAELLTQIGLCFEVVPTGIDETNSDYEDIPSLVKTLAVRKAAACREMLSTKNLNARLPILAADTLVSMDQVAIGKPRGRSDALRMLKALSGRTHDVYTGIAVQFDEQIFTSVVSATVLLRQISSEEIDWYCDSGEPFDKAGSYGIQGVGGIFVSEIQGQPSTVAGLPLRETEELLRRVGVNTWRDR